MEILYQDDSYRVVRTPGPQGADVTIILFDSWASVRHPTEPVAFSPVEDVNFATKAGFNLIHVQNRRNDWYQGATISETLGAVLGAKKPGDIFVSYGSSMGGYAATAFCDDIAADVFVSFSPQASISSAYMAQIGDTRWRDCHPIFQVERIVGQPNDRCPGAIFFDPKHPQDAAHAHDIARYRRAASIKLEGGWHHSLAAIYNTAGWRPTLDALIDAGRGRRAFDEVAAELEQKVNESLLVRFARADGLQRTELLESAGVEQVRKIIDLCYICWQFPKSPRAEDGAVLHRLAIGSTKAYEVGVAANTLATHGFGALADELKIHASGLTPLGRAT